MRCMILLSLSLAPTWSACASPAPESEPPPSELTPARAQLARELLMQKVGCFQLTHFPREGSRPRDVQSRARSIIALDEASYGEGVPQRDGAYRFWRLYSRTLFYDAFFMGPALEFPAITYDVMAIDDPDWSTRVRLHEGPNGEPDDDYQIWPRHPGSGIGDQALSEGICATLGSRVLSRLIENHSVELPVVGDWIYALDLDGDGEVDVSVRESEIDSLEAMFAGARSLSN